MIIYLVVDLILCSKRQEFPETLMSPQYADIFRSLSIAAKVC